MLTQWLETFASVDAPEIIAENNEDLVYFFANHQLQQFLKDNNLHGDPYQIVLESLDELSPIGYAFWVEYLAHYVQRGSAFARECVDALLVRLQNEENEDKISATYESLGALMLPHEAESLLRHAIQRYPTARWGLFNALLYLSCIYDLLDSGVARRLIESALQSEHPEERKYALELLSPHGHRNYHNARYAAYHLATLTQDPDPQIQARAAHLLEDYHSIARAVLEIQPTNRV